MTQETEMSGVWKINFIVISFTTPSKLSTTCFVNVMKESSETESNC